jgi:hypothetical protein
LLSEPQNNRFLSLSIFLRVWAKIPKLLAQVRQKFRQKAKFQSNQPGKLV